MAERPLVGLSLGYEADALHQLPGALRQAEALGAEQAEIFLPALGVVVGARLRREACAEAARICADSPLPLSLHGPLSGDLGREAGAALERDALLAGLDAAAAMGADLYVQHSVCAEPKHFADAMRRERDALAALAPEAASRGVVIAVETMAQHPGERVANPAELADTLNEVAAPGLGATLDLSHAALTCAAQGRDWFADCAALAPHVRHLHLHDSFARTPSFRPWTQADAVFYGFGDLHLPPGAGSLPWEQAARLDFRDVRAAVLELSMRWRWETGAALDWTRNWLGPWGRS